MKVLLDTHAALLAAEGDTRLGNEAAALVRQCRPGEAVISGVTLLEIAMLANKGRVAFSIPLRDYLRQLQDHYPALPLVAEIAASAVDLELPDADPFDRAIVATAMHHRLPLATRNQSIISAKIIRTIW